MNREEFEVIMPYISDDLVSVIAKNKKISEIDAIKMLYSSKLYSMLEDEENKVWQYSTQMLYSLFEQEQKNGKIIFPDV